MENKILLQGGGHAMAGGFSIEQNKYQDFCEFLEQKVANTDMTETVLIDSEVDIELISHHLLALIDKNRTIWRRQSWYSRVNK